MLPPRYVAMWLFRILAVSKLQVCTSVKYERMYFYTKFYNGFGACLKKIETCLFFQKFASRAGRAIFPCLFSISCVFVSIMDVSILRVYFRVYFYFFRVYSCLFYMFIFLSMSILRVYFLSMSVVRVLKVVRVWAWIIPLNVQ